MQDKSRNISARVKHDLRDALKKNQLIIQLLKRFQKNTIGLNVQEVKVEDNVKADEKQNK